MSKPKFVLYTSFQEYSPDEMLERARVFREELQRHRTICTFSSL